LLAKYFYDFDRDGITLHKLFQQSVYKSLVYAQFL